MSPSAKLAIWSGIALIVGGAAWLMIERGPAILVDLAGAVMACF